MNTSALSAPLRDVAAIQAAQQDQIDDLNAAVASLTEAVEALTRRVDTQNR